ncbi:MAG: SAM-dependent methyltransferase [Paludibacteraceae bacterium]|nr:SAM-dependent methyltransferase [Paludibacteraceae bacterium]
MATSTQQKQELFKTIWAIADNGYNLSVNSYVEQEDTREEINIEELKARIKELRVTTNRLFDEIDALTKNIR